MCSLSKSTGLNKHERLKPATYSPVQVPPSPFQIDSKQKAKTWHQLKHKRNKQNEKKLRVSSWWLLFEPNRKKNSKQYKMNWKKEKEINKTRGKKFYQRPQYVLSRNENCTRGVQKNIKNMNQLIKYWSAFARYIDKVWLELKSNYLEPTVLSFSCFD